MVQDPIEVINNFLNGHDPMEHIVAIECEYGDDEVFLIYINDKGKKVVRKEKLGKKHGVWHYIGLDTLYNVVGAIILVPLSYLSLMLIL